MVWGGDGYTGASRNSRLGGAKPKCPHMYKKGPPYVQKAPQIEKKVAKMPPHGKTSSQ